MFKRIIILGALAVVFGGLTVFTANYWLDNNIETVVVEKEVQPEVKMGTIVVAVSDFGYGTQITDEVVKTIPWPADAMPDGAFNTVEEILRDGSRAALGTIYRNEPVLAAKLTGSDERAKLSYVVPEGMRAVAVQVNDVTGVSGFVTPGDRVDLILLRELFLDKKKREEGQAADAQASLAARPVGASANDSLYARDTDSFSVATTLLENVQVLSIDQLADEREASPRIAATVTVALTPKDAKKLSAAQGAGTLSLHLRKAGDVTIDPLNLGLDTEPVAAFEPREEIEEPIAIEPIKKTATITVRHKDQTQSVTVPLEGVN